MSNEVKTAAWIPITCKSDYVEVTFIIGMLFGFVFMTLPRTKGLEAITAPKATLANT